MRPALPLLAAAFLVLCPVPSQAGDYRTGMREIAVPDAKRPLAGFLWYPTTEEGRAARAHGNAVWEGVRVVPDAAPAPGRRPLLVLSHGMFGNARNQAWLAKAMTAEGYIVAAVDHPGTSTFARDPDDRRELWERPRDISRLIDPLLGAEGIAERIDRDRVFMAGHSLGGFTAVALAGGRYDPERVDALCADDPGHVGCAIFDEWRVARTPEDRERMAGELSDPRIAGFAVFDPGAIQTFAPESLAAIGRPVLVIGAPVEGAGLDLDREARALAAALPPGSARYVEPPTLGHFDFLGVCTDRAVAILEEENPGDAMVCADGGAARRADHRRIAREVLAFLDAVE